MNRRRFIGAIATLALVAGSLATWTLTASGAGIAMNRFTTTCHNDPGGQFRHQVDPIVSPGVAVSAHNHQFYGRIDVSSTMNSNFPLAPGHETDLGYSAPAYTDCRTYGDWASYWFPTPKWNGVDIIAGELKNTYQALANGQRVEVAPFGMTYVAGDSHATTTLDPHVAFTCGDIDVTSTRPVDCTNVPGGVVTAQITFPDCWDGSHTFDTPAGIGPSHFGYSVNGVCPPGMMPCATGVTPGTPGIKIAQLVTQQTFIDPRTGTVMVNPNNADGTLALSFSSGPYYTYHGDVMNDWNHDLGDFVDACLNHFRLPCAPVINGIAVQ